MTDKPLIADEVNEKDYLVSGWLYEARNGKWIAVSRIGETCQA